MQMPNGGWPPNEPMPNIVTSSGTNITSKYASTTHQQRCMLFAPHYVQNIQADENDDQLLAHQDY